MEPSLIASGLQLQETSCVLGTDDAPHVWPSFCEVQESALQVKNTG